MPEYVGVLLASHGNFFDHGIAVHPQLPVLLCARGRPGTAGSGRMATVKRLLEEMSQKDRIPEDLCYVNCFKDPESPVLIRLPGGTGSTFKRDVKTLVDRLKNEIPQLFESQEYMNMKKEITDTYEQQAGNTKPSPAPH